MGFSNADQNEDKSGISSAILSVGDFQLLSSSRTICNSWNRLCGGN